MPSLRHQLEYRRKEPKQERVREERKNTLAAAGGLSMGSQPSRSG